MRDTTAIHLRLPRSGDDVRLEISPRNQPSRPFRVVELGRLSKGIHTWTWDGRRDDGSRVGDNTFRVEVVSSPARWPESAGPVVVDRTFSPGVAPTVRYSLPPGQAPAVFPRTTVVRDHLTLEDTGVRTYPERPATGLGNLRLEIRDRAGRLVLRQPMSRKSAEQPYFSYDWTARVNGSPLAPGRYRAVVNGRDAAGNHGPGEPLLLWVSRDRLEWRQDTYTVEPAASTIDACFFDGSAGCGDPGTPTCGTVATSDLYLGGLSYRSGVCAPVSGNPLLVAGRVHWFPVVEAVPGRGVDSARVAFRGSPTHPGEFDQGTLSLLTTGGFGHDVTATSSTGAETAEAEPRYWNGVPYGEYDELVPPGVAWTFATHGDAQVDVDRFLVTARYLARASG